MDAPLYLLVLRGVQFGSAAVAGHSCLGVAGTDGHAVRGDRLDAFEVASCEDDVGGGDVLLDPGRFRSSLGAFSQTASRHGSTCAGSSPASTSRS
jgi:hypothetical protein